MSHLYIISAPSGAGKSTLCNAILARFPKLVFSISHTTRSPRKGEQNGVDYYFISKEEFETGIKKEKWAEYAKVHDNYYGTSSKFLDKSLKAGCDALLDIDVQGARQILLRYPEAITIFIMPPSINALKERLLKRGTDSPEIIEKRLSNAKSEIAQRFSYKYLIINDQLERAILDIQNIFESQKT